MRCFDALDWITKGQEVEMCPRDRKGANKLSLLLEGLEEAAGRVEGATRARLVGGAILIGWRG